MRRGGGRRSWPSPPGSLGQLEDMSIRLAGVTGQVCPAMGKCRVAVFAADNGVVAEGVSCTPPSVTLQQAVNMTFRKTGMSAMAAAFGDDVTVVDVGIDGDVPPVGILHRKVRRGTGDIVREDAMTRQQVLEAMAAGIEQAAQAKADGVTALGIGEMGIGNTTTSAAVLAVLTGADVAAVTGRGGGLTDQGFLRKKDVLRQSLALHRPDKNDIIGVLAGVGGLDLAAMTGAFLAAPMSGYRRRWTASSPSRRHCAPCGCVRRRGTTCSCPTTPTRSATALRRRSWGCVPACGWTCGWARAAGVPCCSGCWRAPAA